MVVMANNVAFCVYVPQANRPSGPVLSEKSAPAPNDPQVTALFKRSRDSGSAFSPFSAKRAAAQGVHSDILLLTTRVRRIQPEERKSIVLKQLPADGRLTTVKQILEGLPKEKWNQERVRVALETLEADGKVGRYKLNRPQQWFLRSEKSTP